MRKKDGEIRQIDVTVQIYVSAWERPKRRAKIPKHNQEVFKHHNAVAS